MAGIRFALYADLMLAMGLAAFLMYGLGPGEREDAAVAGVIHRSLPLLCAMALPLSVGWLLALAAGMFGTSISALDAEIIASIVLETSIGTAWLVQVASLSVATVSAFFSTRQPPGAAMSVVATTGIALGALAWSGHAAVGEGALGLLNRAADILHMLAAGLWLGAIAAFAILIGTSNSKAHVIAARELSRFSRFGTAFVAVIAATGLANVSMIARIGDPLQWPPGPYGAILALKIGLFALMLGLASIHRWKLTPKLEMQPSDTGTLRRSLALELVAGMAILAAVAVLGLLEP